MNAIALFVCGVLFLGGLYLMYLAATLSAWQGFVFFGGIICVALSFGLPMTYLKKLD